MFQAFFILNNYYVNILFALNTCYVNNIISPIYTHLVV